MDISLCPYAIAAKWVRDNTAILTDKQTNVCLGWVRARALVKLSACASDPGLNIIGREQMAFFMQLEGFFKKNSLYTVEEDARAAALLAFERGERLCRITNRRLDHYYVQRGRLDPDLALVASRAEAFVSSALGDFDLFLNKLPELVKITGGATASLARRHSLPPLKFQRSVEMCPGSVPYASALCKYWGYSMRMVSENCNRVEFVPKSWKTHRGIACEPTGSLPFQLAFDTYCKRRLRKIGVDLSSQDRNREAAKDGSISGLTATIDLSMASDTLAFNTVAWLLPDRWFKFLCDHRSTQYRLDGSIGSYAKFSSMGNGATFSLETLIFLAIARACGDAESIVYGDDIIISVDAVPLFLRALKFFGFIPNVDKSFTSGPFRESCGGNYYEGIDITPFYLREDAGKDLCVLAHNLNGLQRIASPHGELIDYIIAVTVNSGIPLVPSNDDSMSGFHVHPYVAQRLKLIRTRSKKYGPSVPVFRGLEYTSRSRYITDSRSLALWFLRCNSEGTRNEVSRQPIRVVRHPLFLAILARGYAKDDGETFEGPERGSKTVSEALSCTEYSLPTGKFRRRVRRWVTPISNGAWGGIYYHSELLAAELAAEST